MLKDSVMRRLRRVARLAAPTDDEALVRAAYLILLQREPDAAGLRTHSAAIRSGLSWAGLLAQLIRSEEFEQLHRAGDEALSQAMVRAAFRAVLWREPADDTMQYYSEQLGSGMTLTKLFTALVESGEFEALANAERRRERREAALRREELAVSRRLAALEERVEALSAPAKT